MYRAAANAGAAPSDRRYARARNLADTFSVRVIVTLDRCGRPIRTSPSVATGSPAASGVRVVQVRTGVHRPRSGRVVLRPCCAARTRWPAAAWRARARRGQYGAAGRSTVSAEAAHSSRYGHQLSPRPSAEQTLHSPSSLVSDSGELSSVSISSPPGTERVIFPLTVALALSPLTSMPSMLTMSTLN